jgi:hypothetical protein
MQPDFGIKTNLGEKGILIDGHLAKDRCVEIIESRYSDFFKSY